MYRIECVDGSPTALVPRKNVDIGLVSGTGVRPEPVRRSRDPGGWSCCIRLLVGLWSHSSLTFQVKEDSLSYSVSVPVCGHSVHYERWKGKGLQSLVVRRGEDTGPVLYVSFLSSQGLRPVNT